jgi:hypothetical protein
MIILIENSTRSCIQEDSTNVRLFTEIEEALNIEYINAISTLSDGEFPVDETVAKVVSMAVDAVNKWVYSKRDKKGQRWLRSRTSDPLRPWDSHLDTKLWGMEKILKSAKFDIEKWQKA